jgi:hypothetical protein
MPSLTNEVSCNAPIPTTSHHFTIIAVDSSALAYVLSNLSSRDNSKLVSHLANLVTDSSTCLTHLADLVCNVDFQLPDGMIYKMSSISTKIVFAAEPPEGKDATATSKTAVSGVLSGRAGLKSFRGGATNVLKAVRRHPNLRRSIMLMSLLRSSYFLGNPQDIATA